jgi:uracil-DNA glycosylase
VDINIGAKMSIPKIGNDWDDYIGDEFIKEYYQRLRTFLLSEYDSFVVYPDKYDIFNALKYTPLSTVKAVILGQDPYIKQGEAHGLSFSVKPGIKIPPSLLNIYKEIADDLGCYIPKTGCLTKWANQGVLLLNAVLTVRERSSNSHKNKGWELFTDRVIQVINECSEPVAFMLWGNNAKAKGALITNPKHLVLLAAHPSPLAGGAFFGCRHFSKANDFLVKNGREGINWQI